MIRITLVLILAAMVIYRLLPEDDREELKEGLRAMAALLIAVITIVWLFNAVRTCETIYLRRERKIRFVIAIPADQVPTWYWIIQIALGFFVIFLMALGFWSAWRDDQ